MTHRSQSGKTGPVALEMTFQIAEACGWSVYDPQGSCTSASSRARKFGRYLPWTVTIGGVLGLWLKGLVQAYIRRRRLG